MTFAYVVERRLRPGRDGPLDYDDSPIPGRILTSVIGLRHTTPRGVRNRGMILRFGYGSVFGICHGALRRRVSEPWASAIFAGATMCMTLSMFPLLGGTPPPWRWPADVMATSVRTHAVYVVAVATMDGTLGRRQR